jgi:hypothetical protein
MHDSHGELSLHSLLHMYDILSARISTLCERSSLNLIGYFSTNIFQLFHEYDEDLNMALSPEVVTNDFVPRLIQTVKQYVTTFFFLLVHSMSLSRSIPSSSL